MHILAVTGSLKAGKSTLVETTIRQGVQTGMLAPLRAAYLLNDRPSPDGRMVDGESIRGVARVIPFPNRCFTCEDSGNLARQLRELSEGGETDVVIIEGYGFVAGAETREALAASGYPFDVFSLVDAEHLDDNRAAYGAVIESQIRGATLGIGITHASEKNLAAVLDFVGRNSRAGVPAMEIKKGFGIPPRLFSRLLDAAARPRPVCTGGRGCSCGHGHGHIPHDDHDCAAHHDFFSVTYPLRADVTVEKLQEALRGSPVFRGKGFASGIRFDLLHGAWTIGEKSDRAGIVTLYSRHEEVRIPEDLVDREACKEAEGSTKSLLRQSGDPQATKAALERLASAIPSEPVILAGSDGLRLAVQLEELQLLKQAAQRENVKDEWLLKAVSIAVRYWIACARFIESRESEMDRAELPTSRLELGLSLGWWTDRFEKELDRKTVDDVVLCRVGDLVRLGRLGTKAPSNAVKAAAQEKYCQDVMRFAARHGQG